MKLLVFIFALLAAASAPASACSVVAGYRVPTNIELIDEADLVVLAKVVSGPDSLENLKGEDVFEPRIVLEPIRALKGSAPEELRVFGYFKLRDGEPFPIFPTSLEKPHPTTMMGACIRQGYAKGAMLIAMFKKTDAGYRQLGEPFARAVEDVATPSSLWVRAAETYVTLLSDRRPEERRRAFEAERDRLRVLSGDPDAQAIAADISLYLIATSGG